MAMPKLEQRQETSKSLGRQDSKGHVLRVPEAATPTPHFAMTLSAEAEHEHEVPIKAALTPVEIYEHIVEAGVVKDNWPLSKTVYMGIIAAMYIGFSYVGMLSVGGQLGTIKTNYPGIYNLLLGGFGFPLGLFMICVVGADLFTSDCSYFMVAVWEGRIPWHHYVRMVIFSWWTNCAGSMIMALIVFWAQIFHNKTDYLYWLVEHKTEAPFGAVVCKGILANWLVNLAVWIANAAQDITGKAVGIWLPISCFIAMGGEHCIANQFVFTLGHLLGSEVDTRTMIVKNLIPSTIGNIIGGSFFVATMYSLALGSLHTTCKGHVINAAKYANSQLPASLRWAKYAGVKGSPISEKAERDSSCSWIKMAQSALQPGAKKNLENELQDKSTKQVATSSMDPTGLRTSMPIVSSVDDSQIECAIDEPIGTLQMPRGSHIPAEITPGGSAVDLEQGLLGPVNRQL